MKAKLISATVITMMCFNAVLVYAQESPKHVTITTRAAGEFSANINANTQGPAEGDVAMQILLHNNGISSRIVPDQLFYDVFGDSYTLNDTGVIKPVDLVILSGSSGSTDVPDVLPLFDAGTAIMMGEHVCLASRTDRQGSFKMYKASGHGELRNFDIRRIRIVNKNHPITQGIETDAEGYVQVFRDPDPTEGVWEGWQATTPANTVAISGLYENRLALGQRSLIADGGVILAEIDPAFAPNPDLIVCLAVLDKGGVLGDGTVSNSRIVHWMSNEEGSGGPHRNFLALNKTGRELFVRAARWALDLPVDTAVNDFGLFE